MIELMNYMGEFSYLDDYFGDVLVHAKILEPSISRKHRVYSVKVLDLMRVPVPKQGIQIELNLPNNNEIDEIFLNNLMRKLAIEVYKAYVNSVIKKLDDSLVENLDQYSSRDDHDIDTVIDQLNRKEHIFYMSYSAVDIYESFIAEFDMVPSVIDRVNYYSWEGWIISTIEYMEN